MSDQKIFYLTTNPGLESVAHLELCKKWVQAADFFNLPSYPDVKLLKGGLEFTASLPMVLFLNRNLKTSTRILLRLKTFSAKNENEFTKEMESVPWKSFFNANESVNFKFQSKSSKLSHSKQITRVLEKVLKKHKVKVQKGQPQLYIRIFRDQCTLSIDTTGEASFFRKEAGSIASLRSSLASGLLQILFQGIESDIELIDPMCGAGTFLSESLSMDHSLARSFFLESFPLMKDSLTEMPVLEEKNLVKKTIGFDFHEKALHVAAENLKNFKSDYLEISKADLFSKSDGLVSPSGMKRVVVVNPPWGKRLHLQGQGDVLETLYHKYKPDRIGLLMPARWKTVSIPLEKVRDIPINNSGVENRFLVFAKSGV